MICWRLTKSKYSQLDGEGGRIVASRWNSRGIPIIYTGDSPSLCLVESKLHLEDLPTDYVLLRIKVPDSHVVSIESHPLLARWQSNEVWTRSVGDEWVRESSSIGLSVPSAIVPNDRVILLNPTFPDFATPVQSETVDFPRTHWVFSFNSPPQVS